MGFKKLLKAIGISLGFVITGVLLTANNTFSWLLGLLIFYYEIRK